MTAHFTLPSGSKLSGQRPEKESMTKNAIIFYTALIGILLFGGLAIILREPNLGAIPEHLLLKIPSNELLFEKTIRDMRCDPRNCQDFGDIKKYYYIGKEVLVQKASDLLSFEELTKHGLSGDAIENINKRTGRVFVFERTDGKTTYVFKQENKLLKRGGKWHKVESATTTIEAFKFQTSFRGINVAYATDFTPSGKVDGYVNNSGATYATVQSAATGNGSSDSAVITYIQNAYDESGTIYYIHKSFFLFDTSSLSGTVDTASFKCYGAYHVNAAGNDSYRLTTSTPASETALITADFDQVGETAGATDIGIASFVNGGWNTWTMNAIGEGWIDVDGTTKLAIRSALDIAATQPGNADDVIGCDTVEGTNASTLTVTMEAAAAEEIQIPAIPHLW